MCMACAHDCILRTYTQLARAQGAVDIEAVTDPTERQSIELQIREFGQTPKKVTRGISGGLICRGMVVVVRLEWA